MTGFADPYEFRSVIKYTQFAEEGKGACVCVNRVVLHQFTAAAMAVVVVEVGVVVCKVPAGGRTPVM